MLSGYLGKDKKLTAVFSKYDFKKLNNMKESETYYHCSKIQEVN